MNDPILVEGERDFSVFEVFGALLSEVTFAGLPDDRDEQWKNVVDTAEDYIERKEDIEDNDDEEEDEEE